MAGNYSGLPPTAPNVVGSFSEADRLARQEQDRIDKKNEKNRKKRIAKGAMKGTALGLAGATILASGWITSNEAAKNIMHKGPDGKSRNTAQLAALTNKQAADIGYRDLDMSGDIGADERIGQSANRVDGVLGRRLFSRNVPVDRSYFGEGMKGMGLKDLKAADRLEKEARENTRGWMSIDGEGISGAIGTGSFPKSKAEDINSGWLYTDALIESGIMNPRQGENDYKPESFIFADAVKHNALVGAQLDFDIERQGFGGNPNAVAVVDSIEAKELFSKEDFDKGLIRTTYLDEDGKIQVKELTWNDVVNGHKINVTATTLKDGGVVFSNWSEKCIQLVYRVHGKDVVVELETPPPTPKDDGSKLQKQVNKRGGSGGDSSANINQNESNNGNTVVVNNRGGGGFKIDFKPNVSLDMKNWVINALNNWNIDLSNFNPTFILNFVGKVVVGIWSWCSNITIIKPPVVNPPKEVTTTATTSTEGTTAHTEGTTAFTESPTEFKTQPIYTDAQTVPAETTAAEEFADWGD